MYKKFNPYKSDYKTIINFPFFYNKNVRNRRSSLLSKSLKSFGNTDFLFYGEGKAFPAFGTDVPHYLPKA